MKRIYRLKWKGTRGNDETISLQDLIKFVNINGFNIDVNATLEFLDMSEDWKQFENS